MTARFQGTCKSCGFAIKLGEQAFYYPSTKSIYCEGKCGNKAYRDFQSSVADEQFYQGK
jgi:hypothetical protein